MTTLSIQLSDKALASFKQLANQRGTTVEEVVQTALENVELNEASSPSMDDFKKAMRFVLDKNSELYKRLA
ncbi:MAG: DNA-binding protein [Bacteroidia bacterium]